MTTKTLDGLWKEYLSHEPSKSELRLILFRNSERKLKEIVWKELRKRDDIDNNDIVEALLYCCNAEEIRSDAWEMLSERDPSTDDLERIIEYLGLSNPIAKEAQKILGRGKAEILYDIGELVKVVK